MNQRSILIGEILTMTVMAADPAGAARSPEADRQMVAALDLEYQAAVKRNDFETMDRILHEDFVLVLGNGSVISREALFEDERHNVYEHQDEVPGTQTVRVWGDTAVVTAKLWLKGHGPTGPFDRTLWFSDTYVRTPLGWRYVFAQASLALPPEAQQKDPL